MPRGSGIPAPWPAGILVLVVELLPLGSFDHDRMAAGGAGAGAGAYVPRGGGENDTTSGGKAKK